MDTALWVANPANPASPLSSNVQDRSLRHKRKEAKEVQPVEYHREKPSNQDTDIMMSLVFFVILMLPVEILIRSEFWKKSEAKEG